VNGNGNGHSVNGNGNGHHPLTTLAAPEAPGMPSALSPEVPISGPQLPTVGAPPSSDPIGAKPLPSVIPEPASTVTLPEPFMTSPYTSPGPVAPAQAVYFIPPRGADPQDVVEAQARAQQILLDAEREARHLVRGAEAYADEVLGQLELEVGQSLQIVQNGRSFLASRRSAPQQRFT
jgi:hypothetical protein